MGNEHPGTSYWDWATALNCWPANIEADQIVYANQLAAGTTGRLEASNIRGDDVATDLYPTQKWHNKGPQHVYGSYEILDRAHDASNTNPEDNDRTTATNNTENYESNQLTVKHVKNGYFAGYGESAGAHGTADEILNLHQEDPVLRSGLGGLYQYGHDTWNQNSGAHNQDMEHMNKSFWQRIFKDMVILISKLRRSFQHGMTEILLRLVLQNKHKMAM